MNKHLIYALVLTLVACSDDLGSADTTDDLGSEDTTDDPGTDTTDEAPETAYEGYPFVSNFIELESGAKMHYLDEGAGDPMILVHGVPTQAYLWRDMVDPLSEHGRVIVPDMINFGLSDKTEALTPEEHVDNLTQLVEALGLTNVTFVVQDWGVPWGVNVAANNPERVRALAFFEGPFSPIPDMSGLPPAFLEKVIDPTTAAPAILEDNWFVECFLLTPDCMNSNAKDWTDAEREVYRAAFPTPESREQLLLLPQHLPFIDTTGHPVLDPDGPGGEPAQPSPSLALFQANTAYLTSSEVPKLFIHGAPGLITNGAMVGAQLQATMPNLEFTQVGSDEDPTYHFIQEDAPVELAETIGAFIDSL